MMPPSCFWFFYGLSWDASQVLCWNPCCLSIFVFLLFYPWLLSISFWFFNFLAFHVEVELDALRLGSFSSVLHLHILFPHFFALACNVIVGLVPRVLYFASRLFASVSKLKREQEILSREVLIPRNRKTSDFEAVFKERCPFKSRRWCQNFSHVCLVLFPASISTSSSKKKSDCTLGWGKARDTDWNSSLFLEKYYSLSEWNESRKRKAKRHLLLLCFQRKRHQKRENKK